MRKFGAAASLLIEQFDPENLLKFVEAFEVAGGKDVSWAKAVVSQHVHKYTFLSISLDVALSTQVPGSLMKARDSTHMSGTIGRTFMPGTLL